MPPLASPLAAPLAAQLAAPLAAPPDNYKLWGGCFEEEPSDVLRRLNDSLGVDVRLYREDIRGSKAWAQELHRSGHLSDTDNQAIQTGLEKVEKDIEEELSHKTRLCDPEEDIHSVVERRLYKYAGDAALRLHTARSRNDQTVTDAKLWMISAFQKLQDEILRLINVITTRAETEIDVIIPGYTHLQRAQPIRWSHFLLSYAWMLRDDVLRLQEQKNRLSLCPLGSGALAGCAITIDRERLAHSLGFNGVTPNSMFGVGSRDYIVEFLNWASLCGLHLSRLSEDLIIYSSQEFGFIQFSDQFSTGSSLMPHKRNPDGLELVRGAGGLLLGDAFTFSCILKGLPSTYNKDLQSDKEILFRSYDKLIDCLKVTNGTMKTMMVNAEKGTSLLDTGMLATDLAYALVRRGVPFRRAHHFVGAALKRALTLGVDLQHMPHEEYLAICPEFGREEDIQKVFSWEASVEQYTTVGGTSRAAVQHQIDLLRAWLQDYPLTCNCQVSGVICDIVHANINVLKYIIRIEIAISFFRMIAEIKTMALLAACILIPAVLSQYNNPIEIASGIADTDQSHLRYISNEDIGYMKNLIDAYRNYRRLATDFEVPHDQDTKYQVWKRNADIINTLLGIPRRMLIVGR
ncbi:argininosuccinate lyase [Epargyreus clarus]|uniref:argininosuccinate lyase n=1 Tax=Epargyreus clarus TaxID=520877 RepID=UPI003C30AA6A